MQIFRSLKNTVFNKPLRLIILLIIGVGCAVFLTINNQYFLNITIAAIILLLLLLAVYLTYFLQYKFFGKSFYNPSKLTKRIIVAFSIGAAFPTIIVAIFASYFFNFGMDIWFDKKISKVLDQSIQVGNLYLEENRLQLKETAFSVAADLNSMYYELIHNPAYFNRVINAQAEMRSFDEAIVFQYGANTILAQTTLSFSLAFATIPAHIVQQADQGQAVLVNSDSNKIRILIKLREYENTYLLIGRLIDKQILDHIDQANGAAKEYHHLKQQIDVVQLKFTLLFVCVSGILLTIAIVWGRHFAKSLVRPLKALVIASEKAKNGDLDVQVEVEHLQRDELKILSSAFNRMIKQISYQQQELVIAQRSLAWSDVARRVAHEIKNPLTPIQLSAERLLVKYQPQVQDQENFNKYIKNILKHSQDISNIVKDFVEFARLPAPNFATYEIKSFLEDLISSRRLINENIRYKLISNITEYQLVCDIGQINRIMVNLILNSEESLANVDNVVKTIEVHLIVEQDKLRILVIDNGPGFSDKLLNSATNAYITDKPNGTGLGLAIVERIVVDHFGAIKISNIKPCGAKIELSFKTDKLQEKLK